MTTHRRHVRETEDEAYRVKNVRLARPVEARNGIEGGIPARYLGPDRIGLESVQDELLDVHVVLVVGGS